MPDFNAIHLVIAVLMTILGAVLGWVLRSRRSAEEKAAVNAGWQEQFKAKQTEHDRLTDQNKGLMEQIGQYQASNKDAKNRARELSEAVQEAYARRDDLQREIKDVRGNLETTLSERDRLQSDISAKAEDSTELDAKDARIKKLKLELDKWQKRLPPLIEKFRQQHAETERLSAELLAANEQIAELEAIVDRSHTRIEPVGDPDALTNGRDASNDPIPEDDTKGVRALPEERALTPFDGQPFDGPPFDGPSNDVVDDVRDDLQSIKGVGPAIEKTLNEMGIVSFRQIAEMSEYDIDRVAKRLKGFHSRIYREDWIGQARELRDQASSD